jgi:hypothetical protein
VAGPAGAGRGYAPSSEIRTGVVISRNATAPASQGDSGAGQNALMARAEGPNRLALRLMSRSTTPIALFRAL